MSEPGKPGSRPCVLVIDDDAGIRESLRIVLADGYEVDCAADGEAGLARLEELSPDLVLLDIVMPGLDGIAVLERLKSSQPEAVVIMLTAVTSLKTVVDAMRRGAEDYIAKPFEVGEVKLVLERALERRDLKAEVRRLRSELAERFHFDRIIGHAKAMRAIYETIEQVADRRATVLVRGESGTGKELVARAIHFTGQRQEKPFIVVNCAAIPETLLESQLFGHEKGAFTDARERRVGQFEAAGGGTLFLDEIGELTPPMQVKLLRVLQEREVLPVGANEPVRVDVRIITATNKDLEDAVHRDEFRKDLYYRINVVPIVLPPLRDRREDIPQLLEHFLEKFSEGDRRLELTGEAVDALVAYAWPGNVRELENTVERLVALAPSDTVALAHLPANIREGGRVARLRADVLGGRLPFPGAVEAFESDLLREALSKAAGNQSSAAALLGITRRVLKYKLDRYGIPVKARPAS